MSENTDATDEQTAKTALSTAPVKPSYKILGQFTDSNGAGVLGQNDANTGTPVGVQGAVPNSSDGYGLGTDDAARVGQTLELGGDLRADAALELTVSGGTRALTLEEPNTDSSGDTAGANVVAGHPDNTVKNDAAGCVISGGGEGGASRNAAYNHYCTVGGGRFNEAGEFDFDDDNDPSTNRFATVSGGYSNIAAGEGATVGGGELNRARGDYGTVPGGESCVANSYCFAAGRRAKTKSLEEGVFIWADSKDADFKGSDQPNNSGITGDDTFKARARGGVLFVTEGGSTYISGNSTGWSTSSSRAMKTNIDPVDPRQALDSVDSLEIATWEYERDEEGEGTGVRHIGPMAEEFHKEFDVGDSDEHINSVNADGVTFAAIQGLSAELDERDERIEDLEAELDEKEERIDELEKRLAAIESQLETTAQPGDD